jgi:hypothetical protein
MALFGQTGTRIGCLRKAEIFSASGKNGSLVVETPTSMDDIVVGILANLAAGNVGRPGRTR